METFLEKIKNQKELAWINPYLLPVAMTEAVCQLVVSDADIEDAARRLVPEEVWEEYLKKAGCERS